MPSMGRHMTQRFASCRAPGSLSRRFAYFFLIFPFLTSYLPYTMWPDRLVLLGR